MSISTRTPIGRVASASAARRSTPAMLSTTTERSATAARTRTRRWIIPVETTDVVSRMPSRPAPAMTSTSRTVAQQRPTAPAAICFRAMSGDLCALTCGRSLPPCCFTSAAIAARFASNPARSTRSAGVEKSGASTGLPISSRFGPGDIPVHPVAAPSLIPSARRRSRAARNGTDRRRQQVEIIRPLYRSAAQCRHRNMDARCSQRPALK